MSSRSPDDPSRGTAAEIVRLQRRLKESTLQTLEFIAHGGSVGERADIEELMRLAAREATELRNYLDRLLGGEDAELARSLGDTVSQERVLAEHEIRLVTGAADGSVKGLDCLDLAAAVREALVYARLHAQARHVTVYLEEQSGQVLITVKDDGVGAEIPALDARLGVRHSLNDRMARLGASVDIRSSKDYGTTISLQVPART